MDEILQQLSEHYPDIYCVQCDKDVRPQKLFGYAVYPHREDLRDKMFYQCPICGNYVGTHRDGRPLGTIPTAPLRKARNRVHKIIDLSVGDLVLNRKGVPTKVQVIVSEGNMRCGEDAKPEHSVHIWVTDVEPIPITPEILEKNGFVKWQGGLVLIGDDISCRYEDDNLTIEQGYRDKDGVLIERLLVNIECKAVHQLQHALRLAGVEKEIEL